MKKNKLLLLSLLSVLGMTSCGQAASTSDSSAAASSTETPTSAAASETSSEAASSGEAASSSEEVTEKTYTYHDYTSVSPSNWNELTYQDANDTQIMSYIGGSFFNFNYEFDDKGNIVDGGFTIEYDGLTKAEDVTASYAGKYNVPETATGSYAYKFTLRDDIKWDDGTGVTAADFVYTMKEQLNPLFQNYRADSFYAGSLQIANAHDYLVQGQSGMFASKTVYGGVYDSANDADMVFDITGATGSSYLYSKYIAKYASYIKTNGIAWLLNTGLGWGTPLDQAAYDALAGKTLAEIKADATLKGYWDSLIGWWQTEPGEELDFFVTSFTYPEVSFDQVGLFVGDNEYELVLVLDSPLAIFKEDGSLSYKAAYNLSGLPLVKKDLYEANKHEPASGSTLWTTTYNTSLASSASWGPYKLESFQAGKQYVLVRNENWYGYGMDKYKGQYQADKIVCDTIDSWETAWQSFLAGDITGIGLDVSVAADYKNSQRAVFTADDYVGSLQLQSSAEALKGRETEGIDKEMMTYVDFRKAISLAINRADYTQKCTTASQAGFGLFNEMHYYDVENAGVYRHEDAAKEVICATYGVDPDDYESLDAAVAAVTGYDLTLARSLVDKAYDEAIAAGTISETDKVVFTVGTAVDNESTRRTFNYLKEAFETLAVGTKLEGRLTLEFDASFGDEWADDFRDGAYDICTGAWSGAAWNPGYLLMAYLDPNYMYSSAWDTSAVYLDYNPFQDGNDENIISASLIEWWGLLNGDADAIKKYGYDFSEGEVDNEIRLGIIAALEGEILKVYYSVPLYNYYSASLLSYQVEYISTTYNTFMAYGGLRYMSFNYDDAAWEAVKGTFDYKA